MRPDGIGTLLKVHTTNMVSTEEHFFINLCKAITKWVKSTDVGKEAYKNTSGELHIGNLYFYMDDKDLQLYLKEQGIYLLEYEGFTIPGNFTYDTNLVNNDD